MYTPFGYSCCFFLPLSTLAFLLTPPHTAGAALLWTLPVWAMVGADWLGPKNGGGEAIPVCPQWIFDGILYALALLQFANILALLAFVAGLRFANSAELVAGLCNLVAARVLVGTSSGSSGIIVAHELVHRPHAWQRLLGRALLCSVCYEHFAIAHIRGHHLHVGMRRDIAAARRGESFSDYWWRVCPGHFRYAWQEERRHAGTSMPGWLAYAKNRVLHGVVCELLLLLGICIVFGWLAALLFIYQAFAAVRLLETINYFQHWGLAEGKGKAAIAWTCGSWFSQYCLIGLTNHIAHHQDAAKPYHLLHPSTHGPQLPYGYFVMNLWVKLDNSSYRQTADKELARFERLVAG